VQVKRGHAAGSSGRRTQIHARYYCWCSAVRKDEGAF
jgi:hypothetical protein